MENLFPIETRLMIKDDELVYENFKDLEVQYIDSESKTTNLHIISSRQNLLMTNDFETARTSFH
jgi:hypothetical protein